MDNNEIIKLTESLIEGNDIKEISINLYPKINNQLNILRHKSLINNEFERLKKIEYLINILNHQTQLNKKINNNNNKIEILNKKKNYFLKIINNLLEGYLIKNISIEEKNKLIILIKEEINLCILNSTFLKASKLETILNYINNFKNLSSPSSPKKIQSPIKKINEESQIEKIIKKIENYENILNKLNKELEIIKNKLQNEKDIFENNLFQDLSLKLEKLNKKKVLIENGLSFKPSKKLLELNRLKKLFIKMKNFNEADKYYKLEQNLEINERKEFYNNSLIKINLLEQKILKNFEEQKSKLEFKFKNSRRIQNIEIKINLIEQKRNNLQNKLNDLTNFDETFSFTEEFSNLEEEYLEEEYIEEEEFNF